MEQHGLRRILGEGCGVETGSSRALQSYFPLPDFSLKFGAILQLRFSCKAQAFVGFPVFFSFEL